MNDYDTWKLQYEGQNSPDLMECEHCETVYSENSDLLREFSYYDADRDLRTGFYCEKCIEAQFWV